MISQLRRKGFRPGGSPAKDLPSPCIQKSFPGIVLTQGLPI
jgi:hypothetical protein